MQLLRLTGQGDRVGLDGRRAIALGRGRGLGGYTLTGPTVLQPAVCQVVDIVDIQLSATAFGFARNIPIYWKGFLKFIWTNRRERNKEKNDLFRTVLDEDNNLSPKDREYFHYLARVSSHINYKTLERLGVNAKALTVDEVKAIPSNSPHFLNFKVLIKKK